MRIYYPLPALPRNGGIKVCIQHSHMLNEAGYDCQVITPSAHATPYPSYTAARFNTIAGIKNAIEKDDIFVFNWPPDIPVYRELAQNNRKIYFSQGVINTECPEPCTSYLNDDFELWTIGKHSRDFYMYGYGKNSHIVNNWIDSSVFTPAKGKEYNAEDPLVGIMQHRQHFNQEVVNLLKENNYRVSIVQGSEQEVVSLLRNCDLFVACSPGVYNNHDTAEGFPLPAAEAMACGAIPFSYENHGCREYIVDNLTGFVIPEQSLNSPRHLFSMVNNFVNNTSQQAAMEISRAGTKYIATKFSKENILKQIIFALEKKLC